MKQQKEVKEMSTIEIQDRLRSFLENKNLTLESQYFLLKQIINDIEQEIMEEEEVEENVEEEPIDELDDDVADDEEEPEEIEEAPVVKKKQKPVVKEIKIAKKPAPKKKPEPEDDEDEDEF